MTAPLPLDRPRNEQLVDMWSLSHVAWGIALTWLLGPFWALLLLSLWEPFEVLLVSPALARRGVSFGHESLRNSLLDLVFNAAGVVLAALHNPIPGGPPLASPWP